MVFSSTSFMFGFLPIVMLLYFTLPKRFQNTILAVSGLLFYAWGEPIYVALMIFTIIIDYSAGLLMNKFDADKRARLTVLIISVILNLGIFAVFKYASFFIENINAVFGAQLIDPKLSLPIGISFYTFQAMSYTIDLYRREIKVQRNIINFTGYVTMFPQLIAGPIVRYSDVEKELGDRKTSMSETADGISIFVRGFGKKILLANGIGAVWTQVKAMDYATMPTLTAWIGIIAFTFQIFYDFSGYSDMAIGLGRMLGFHFPKNFDLPYISKSATEFWRRWHITLGSWFRSYVYIPLGGNRCGKLKNIRNIAIVWALTGLWHGASWNFVLWGLYFGAILILEKFVYGKALEKLPNLLQHIYALLIIVFGWVLFEMRTVGEISGFLSAMLGLNGAGAFNKTSFYLLLSNLLLFVVCALCSTRAVAKLAKAVKGKSDGAYRFIAAGGTALIFIIGVCYMVTSAYNPFLYFNF